MKPFIEKAVQSAFGSYPSVARKRLLELRILILSVAGEDPEGCNVVETLKWGEPSYLCPEGSTTRLAWLKSRPEFFSIFFKCTSRLIPTFRKIYPDTFEYLGNREIRFGLDASLPSKEL